MNNGGTLTWDFLQRNLLEQVAIYRSLLSLLVQENHVLIHHDVDVLAQLTPKKDELNAKAFRLREEYLQIVGSIMVGEDVKQIAMDHLIVLAPERVKPQLLASKDELLALHGQMKQYQFMNTKLVEQSMKYVSYMLKQTVGLSQENQQIYCHQGYAQPLGGQQALLSIVA